VSSSIGAEASAAPETIFGETTITEQDLLHTLENTPGARWLKWLMLPAMALGFAPSFVFGEPQPLALLLFPAAFALFVRFALLPFALRRAARQALRSEGGPTMLALDADGLTIEREDTRVELSWRRFDGHRRKRGLLLLGFRKQSLVPIPERAFSAEDLRRVIALLESKAPRVRHRNLT
jgi:hypothetical protein